MSDGDVLAKPQPRSSRRVFGNGSADGARSGRGSFAKSVLRGFLLAACPLWATAASAAGSAALALEKPADHQLVWADDFDRPGLPDASKWQYDTGRNREGWHNRELQYYAAARRANSEVRGGHLHLTARREALRDAPDWGGQAYTSARLMTRDQAAWTYGYFEIRAKLACGKGTWPAIWMLGREGDWPAAGELDIVEHIGHEPGRVFSTVHTASGYAGQGKGGTTAVPSACTAFHTYQMLWTADAVRFGVDGREHARYERQAQGQGHDARQWPFDKPQFLILNIAVGGDLGGKVHESDLPATMQIDYVRIYQRKP
jgi:beta-glucanase (GH16 family)